MSDLKIALIAELNRIGKMPDCVNLRGEVWATFHTRCDQGYRMEQNAWMENNDLCLAALFGVAAEILIPENLYIAHSCLGYWVKTHGFFSNGKDFMFPSIPTYTEAVIAALKQIQGKDADKDQPYPLPPPCPECSGEDQGQMCDCNDKP